MKQAIITGAGSGLGRAIAEALDKAGYRLGVMDIDGESAERVAAALAHGMPLVADVSDEAAVDAALADFAEPPDVLINNAGLVRFGALHEQTVAEFKLTLNVNLLGTYIVARAVARKMLRASGGVIINMSSVNAISPGPLAGAYAASKAGVARLTEQMAMEWGASGIRVNSIAPGFIDAGMSTPIYAAPEIRESRGQAVPSRRLGLAEDVVNAALFLISEKAAYINGHQLVVDGGVIHSVLAQLPRA